MANDYPRTIEELRAFCEAHNMPLEQMRFFIGEDYREPRAFGICKDAEGNFVVYKNKADGSRAVRYCGPDEAYAVRELYLKLADETAARYHNGNSQPLTKKQKRVKALSLIAVALAVAVILYFAITGETKRGYYRYNDSYYYNQTDQWYLYNNILGWQLADDLDDAFVSDADTYYLGGEYSGEYEGIENFADSDYYTPSSSDDGWNNDYSGWDSSSTNWSSDW